MGKLISDSLMDLILNELATSDLMSVTSDVDTPTSLANTLADIAMAPGDFTITEGDSGAGSRKITIAAKLGVDVSADGDPLHVVLSKGGVIQLVTTALGPTLSTGAKVDFPQWKYELVKPS